MKKTAVFTALSILLSAIPCSALQFYEDNVKYGYSLSENWSGTDVRERSQLYTKEATGECICVFADYAQGAYTMELLKEESLNNIASMILSDGVILENYLVTNKDAKVRLSTKAIVGSFEVVNGQKFYKYEKRITVSADGYSPIDNNYTLYITAKNEWMYTFIYNSNSVSDLSGKADFEALIDSLELDAIEIEINGEKVTSDTEPIIVEGRTLVPIRAIAEKMGYSVNWDNDLRKVIMTSADGSNKLEFVIDSEDAYRNGTPFKLDVHAFILKDRTYLPLRAVAEAMDATVNWDGKTTTVKIAQ